MVLRTKTVLHNAPSKKEEQGLEWLSINQSRVTFPPLLFPKQWTRWTIRGVSTHSPPMHTPTKPGNTITSQGRGRGVCVVVCLVCARVSLTPEPVSQANIGGSTESRDEALFSPEHYIICISAEYSVLHSVLCALCSVLCTRYKH